MSIFFFHFFAPSANILKLTDGQFERRSSLVNRISLVEADNARGYFKSLFSNKLLEI